MCFYSHPLVLLLSSPVPAAALLQLLDSFAILVAIVIHYSPLSLFDAMTQTTEMFLGSLFIGVFANPPLPEVL